MQKTSAVVDQLRLAAKAARGGASDLSAARSRVRYVVEDAFRAGFDVREDMSVKDLISHSRPVHQPDGTLRYDVPINRAHCTRGPLGIVDCQDTGESLTMRIVVDPSVGRVDVPDGRQKGVITMYPLEGGSGVTTLGPKWTWTPPWVNTNVPIN